MTALEFVLSGRRAATGVLTALAAAALLLGAAPTPAEAAPVGSAVPDGTRPGGTAPDSADPDSEETDSEDPDNADPDGPDADDADADGDGAGDGDADDADADGPDADGPDADGGDVDGGDADGPDADDGDADGDGAGDGAAAAQEPVDVRELERRIELLADEIERLRSGEQATEVTAADARARGLAPSAAAAYGRDAGVSIAGYGEMLYENFASDRTSEFDYLRAILYAGYRFDDRFVFNSEIEVEHASEIFIEFAYLDFQATDRFGLRAGMLLVPMGLVNEFHEPTVFLGAERPVTEQAIIPSTWRENGAGVYFAGDRIAVRGYVVNGLDGSRFSAGGVRGGRQKGARAKADDLAFTGRIDVTPTPGVFFGASVYAGGSGQGGIAADGVTYGVRTRIVDLHAQAQVRGFDLRALFAQASLDETAALNRALGLTGADGVGETMRGGYLQVGYDLLSQAAGAGGVGLTPYVRVERVDTQAAVAAGFTRSPARNNTYTTLGLELKPIPGIAVKVDHMWVTNDVDSGVNQFNVNVGYAF